MQNSDSAQSDKDLRNVIKINEAQIQDHLGEMVRSTVEETLNAMLDAEADQLCGAKRYERNDKRTNGRAGHYGRNFHTKAGEIELKIPKLRGHYQYYGISLNSQSLRRFYQVALHLVLKWLNRRSQRRSFTWRRFSGYLKRYPLPKPYIVHNIYALSPKA